MIKTKRLTRYKLAVEWIAFNDDPIEKNVNVIEGYISTLLIADVFNKKSSDVASDILNIRIGLNITGRDQREWIS